MTVPQEVEELIADAPLSAHVATSVDDRPHVAPVWYGYPDGVVSVITGGKKLRNVRRNPKVAVSIEKADEEHVAWSVRLLGTATVIDDPTRIRDAEDHVFGKYRDEDENENDADDDGNDGRDDEAESDGGEDPERALVEIEVGSASWSVY